MKDIELYSDVWGLQNLSADGNFDGFEGEDPMIVKCS